ncbi:hypothetical protein CYY_000696 [Polysphondylium violaceum]|uniref:C2 domain-containing protein n=1 Tax=Polysphondylium violaceum TaxID=133409 RepID=A0A8J4V8M6_9MYCE|nr:hypothetical protein CYY_000696 [Polysphondylium violaceum]
MASLKNKKGDLELTLLETKGIKSSEVFAIVDLPPNKPFKTHTFKGPDPKFNEKFTLDLMTFQDDEILITLKEVKTGVSKFIGQVQIPIQALNLPSSPQWYFLSDKPTYKEGQKPKIVNGSVLIHLNFVHRLIRAKSRSSVSKDLGQGLQDQFSKLLEQGGNIPRPNLKPPTSVIKEKPSSVPSDQSSSKSTPSTCSPISSTFSSMEDMYTTKEEEVIIDETLKNKENIVLQQIQLQRDHIKKLQDSVRISESQGKSVVQDKVKIKKMLEEIEDMEQLIASAKSQSLNQSKQQQVQQLPPKQTVQNNNQRPTLSKSSNFYKQQLPSANNKRSDISEFRFEEKKPANVNSSYDDLLAEMDSMQNNSNKENEEKKIQILTKELEKYKQMVLGKQSNSIQTLTPNNKLEIKLKMMEEENQSLIQEKKIIYEKYKLFERESEKLEKELEYELELKRKDSKKIEESKKVAKELELAQSKIKLLTLELDSKSNNNNNNNKANVLTNQPDLKLQYKIKSLELELESERKSKLDLLERIKKLEKDLEKSETIQARQKSELSRLEKELGNHFVNSNFDLDGASPGDKDFLSHLQHNVQEQNNQISLLVTKLEKLDKLEDLMRKLESMKLNQSALGGSGGIDGGKRTHLDIKKEMEELQQIICNEKTKAKDREDANVKFEKLFQELSQTQEYRNEILQMREEKRRINEPLNQKALQKLAPIYNLLNIEKNPELKDRVKDAPELLLIGMDPKAIGSKHQNDFQSYLLRSVNLEELRAIAAQLPKWRPDQKKQAEWTLSLEEKIDQLSKQPQSSNPPAPPRPKPKPSATLQRPSSASKTATLKKPSNCSNTVGHGDLFSELLKKRTKIQ